MCVHYEGKYEFPDKTFYQASSSDFNFTALPDTLDQHREHVNLKSNFTGDHTTVLKQLEAAEGEGDAEAAQPAEGEGEGEGGDNDESSEEDDAIKIPPKNFTELDRITWTVRAIENDCQIIPIGSIKLTPNHEVRRNEAFKGLTHDESLDLNNYLHFRSAQTAEKKKINEEDDAIFRHDFLESINDDPIKGSWSIQSNTTKTQTLIKSLFWPGYYAYLKNDTYGGVYIGTGIKNADLPFML